MRRTLVVIGASGHASVVCDLAASLGYTDFLFLDDRYPRLLEHPFGAVEGAVSQENLTRLRDESFVVAVGNCAVRERLFKAALTTGLSPATLVHPKASVSSRAEVGPGSVVFACAVVAPFARTGAAAIINHGATIDHDCALDDAVHVCPGAHISGGVSVGSRTWVGVGSSVRQSIRIGSDVTIGAGAVVVCDIPAGITVVGVPARAIARTGR